MLMMSATIVPLPATTGWDAPSQSLITGNIFYVGGSGPDNYTKIQDAINAASDGDTVFVYDDSSPYWESLSVNKSIDLIGEDRNTTVITVIVRHAVITINCDNVTVSGFSIQHHKVIPRGEGIFLMGNDCTIEGNIIQNNEVGLALTNSLEYMNPSGHYIRDNIVQNNQYGIDSYCGMANCIISDNYIADNRHIGIGLSGTINSGNRIFYNIVTDNREIGIAVFGTENNITENLVSNHNKLFRGYTGAGISMSGVNNSITRNNLFNNSRHGFQFEWVDNLTEANNVRKQNNFWDANYWGEPLAEPQAINGRVFFQVLRFIRLGVPWTASDEHPAQEPYNIPGMV
jgi:nitrous oxidase accessory protein